jgi:hypothetical protein
MFKPPKLPGIEPNLPLTYPVDEVYWRHHEAFQDDNSCLKVNKINIKFLPYKIHLFGWLKLKQKEICLKIFFLTPPTRNQ